MHASHDYLDVSSNHYHRHDSALTQAKSISNTHSNGADAPWSAHPAYVSVVDVPTGIIYKIKQKIFLNS